MSLRQADERAYAVVTMALSLVCGGVLLSVALHTTPIADDYGWLAQIPHSSSLGFLQSYWNGLTDRYANALLVLVTVKGLGASAIRVTSLLLLFLLCLLSTACLRSVIAGTHARIWAVPLGCVASIAMIVTAPSLFDTFGWYNAVAIYLAAVVAAVGAGAWMGHLARSAGKAGARETILSFVIGFGAAGFTEVMGLVIVATALLATVNTLAVSARPVRRSLSAACFALGAGAATGVCVIFLGPGSQLRAHTQGSHVGLARLCQAVVYNLWYLHFVVSWRALPAIAAGLLCCWLRGPILGSETKRWLLIWFVFLMIAPIVIVALAVGYAGGGPLAAARTAFIATACMTVGVGIVTYLLASALVNQRPHLSVTVAPAAAVALAVGAATFAASALPVIRAEELRSRFVAARGVSIRRQLREHPNEISVMPVPLLDPETGAYDLGFDESKEYDYVIAGIRGYYEIPASAKLRLISSQPPGYCLPNVSFPPFGIRSCEQLHGRGQSPAKTS